MRTITHYSEHEHLAYLRDGKDELLTAHGHPYQVSAAEAAFFREGGPSLVRQKVGNFAGDMADCAGDVVRIKAAVYVVEHEPEGCVTDNEDGWIGVDLDGTLAFYEGWLADGGVGAPVPLMQQRVVQWLAEGKDVRIFTARMSGPDVKAQLEIIQRWCLEHLGKVLPVTNVKDYRMVELYDDRAVQILPNTGMRADGMLD